MLSELTAQNDEQMTLLSMFATKLAGPMTIEEQALKVPPYESPAPKASKSSVPKLSLVTLSHRAD